MTPEFNTVNAVDYGLIALYFGIIVYVGFYAARRNRSTGDYFAGGGKIPWFLAGLSNWVSGFSAFMFVAAAGFTYQHGIGAIVVFTSAAWAYLLGYFYFARRWRRARLSAPLEFLTRRFSSSTTYFYSVTAIVPSIVGIGQGLYILCIFVASALGFVDRTFTIVGIGLSGFQLAVIITGSVMVLYTVAGGLWAAVLSDAVQGVIIGIMSLIILPLSYLYLGRGDGLFAGLGRLWREAPPDFFRLTGNAADPWFLVAYAITIILGYNVAWHLVQRYHSVPDEVGARKMALLCAGLSIFGPLLWILPVMAARVIFPDIATLWPQFANPAEASFVSLALMLLPHGMIGFVVSAILSATLGQANDAFNWLAATVTHDIYAPLRRRMRGTAPTEREQLLAARLTMACVGVFGIAVALYIPRFGGAFQFALIYFSLLTAFQMPVLLGMIFRRTPWWSGMVTCTAGAGVAIALMALGWWSEHAFARNVISITITSTLVFACSAVFFRADNPRHATLARLEEDLRTPVISDDPNARRGALQVYGLIGHICLLLGGVLTLCTFLPGSAVAPSTINLIAGTLLLTLGLALRRFATRPEPISSSTRSA